jgi:hypothetical protein
MKFPIPIPTDVPLAKRIRIGALVGGGVLVLAALWYLLGPGATWRYYSDGISIYRPVRGSTASCVVWEAPERMAGEINAETDTYEPCISADGNRMIFTRGRARVNADMFMSTWTGNGWGTPEPLTNVNTVGDELGPALSADGSLLYFYSDRPGGYGWYDIWIARWDGTTYSTPTNAGPSVNTAYNEYGPATTPGGDRLFFASNRPRHDLTEEERLAWHATLREVLTPVDYDIFAADLLINTETGRIDRATTPRFGECSRVQELNSPADEGQVAVTPRGDFIYFSSRREGGEGGFDLYRARSVHGELRKPHNLGSPVNTPANEMDPAVRLEGFQLVFSSNRNPENPQDYQLYSTIARDVFVEFDWSRLRMLWLTLNNIKWWLLALLGAIALLVYLLRNLMDPELRGKRSLLHTCILGSLLAHALLLILFAFWMISQELTKTLKNPAMEVAIDVDALAQDKISLDIREDVTELPTASDVLIVEQVAHRLPIPEFTPPEAIERPVMPQADVQPMTFEAAEAEVARDAPAEAPQTEVVTALPELVMPKMMMAMEQATQPTPEADKPDGPSLDAPLATATPAQREVLESVSEQAIASAPLSPAADASQQTLVSSVTSARNVEANAAAALDAPSALFTNLPAVTVQAAVTMEEFRPTVAADAGRARSESPAMAAGGDSERAAQSVDWSTPDAPQSVRVAAAATPVARAAAAAARAIATTGSDLPVPKLTGLGEISTPQLPSISVASVLRMEDDGHTSPETYMLRKPVQRGKVLESLGGDDETEKAVQRSLKWLAANQEANGHWSMVKHGGEASHDVAATGMALLCFFGWGATHTEDGPYQQATRRAIDWLLVTMKPNGDLRSKDMYDQGIATMALTEAYGLTKDERLLEPAIKAVDFILKAQHKQTGGWRYGPNQPGDTSVFGWQLMALKSAEMAGLEIPETAFAGADTWLKKVGGGQHAGLYGYENRNASRGMTAEGMFCRQLLGLAPTHPMMRESAGYLKTQLTQANDPYYDYYGTLALYQHQGPIWDEWNTRMKQLVMAKQRTDGSAAGSWNPCGPHANRFGRVVTTAMYTLSLEVYYRYLPLYGLR